MTTEARQKSLILRPHEVRAGLEQQEVTIWRVMKPQPLVEYGYLLGRDHWLQKTDVLMARATEFFAKYAQSFCPLGGVGDLLWVKETWFKNAAGEILYRADYGPESYAGGAKGWRSPMVMPRRASRLILENVGVDVRRLHRIGEESAKATGIEPKPVVSVERGESYLSYCEAFADQWDKDNPRYPWAGNWRAWGVSLRRVTV